METFNFNEPLLNRKEAAKFLNVKPSTMAVWDCTKRYKLHPIKIGNRVRYSKKRLVEFLNEQQKAR